MCSECFDKASGVDGEGGERQHAFEPLINSASTPQESVGPHSPDDRVCGA